MKKETFEGGGKPLTLSRFLLLLILASLAAVQVKAKKFTFTQPGEDDPTILLEADFEISIKAFEKNMVVAAWIGGSHDHPDLTIFGINGKRSVLELDFPLESIAWGLVFNEKSPHDITIDRLVKFIPERIFPPFADLTYPLTFEDKESKTDDILHSALKSFQCDRTIRRIYEPSAPLEGLVQFEVAVTISNFRAQAYHIEGGQFSPSEHCKEDGAVPTTTTARHFFPTPTVTPRPPPYVPVPGGGGSGVPKHKFIAHDPIDNETAIECISMEGRVSFEIAYYVYDGRYQTTRKMVKVGIPQEVKTDGVCQLDAGSQKLTVNFLHNWQVEFLFGINVAYSLPSEQGDHQSKLDYSMMSVSLKYNIDDDHQFPQAFKSEGSNFSISFTERDNLPRKKASSGFFICNTAKRFRMSDDVTLVLSDFKFKAFISDGDTNFYGIPNTCLEDMKQIGASTLVVVVGCLVITFSLIVFIALLALISTKCRTKRRRRKYNAL